MPRKTLDLSKYNKKIDSLCTLLCERLSQTATLLCETLEVQVKKNCIII